MKTLNNIVASQAQKIKEQQKEIDQLKKFVIRILELTRQSEKITEVRKELAHILTGKQ